MVVGSSLLSDVYNLDNENYILDIPGDYGIKCDGLDGLDGLDRFEL